MNIVITMAGEGKRFRDAGIATPKPMIEARGKPLFAWAMASLQNFFSSQFFFIAQKSMRVESFIAEQSRNLGIKNFSVVELDGLTKGQAETALAVQERLPSTEDSVLIYNIDTFVHPRYLEPKDIRGDGWVPCFLAEGDHWSFVQFDKGFRVTDIAEKVRISPYATIGLYYFSSFRLYKQLYEGYPFEQKEEQYVAPLYRLMMESPNRGVYSRIIPEEAVHPLGTPEEVSQFERAKA